MYNSVINIRTFFAGLFIVFSGLTHVFASHIVGAEIYYKLIDPQTFTYEIELIMYRDCLSGLGTSDDNTEFDPEIYLFIFERDAQGKYISNSAGIPKYITLGNPEINPANLALPAAKCSGAAEGQPNNLCVEKGIYKTTVRLAPNTGGYDITWARCCRNNAIINLIKPIETGITFTVSIPGVEKYGINSNPRFVEDPSFFICKGQRFSFDYSAEDSDGDSLVYVVTNPYNGLNARIPGRVRTGVTKARPYIKPNELSTGGIPPRVPPNEIGPPAYDTVSFESGYSYTDPFGTQDFRVDFSNGFLSFISPDTLFPNKPSTYVFAISVLEYRDKVLLSESRRDIQVTVINCVVEENRDPIITPFYTGFRHSGDTLLVPADSSFSFTFSSKDPEKDSLLLFATGPLSTIPDTFNVEVVAGVDSILGKVFVPALCSFENQTLPFLYILSQDKTECGKVGQVKDTVFIRVLPSKNSPSTIQAKKTGETNPANRFIFTAETENCILLEGVDPDIVGKLRLTAQSVPALTGNLPTYDSLSGVWCWTPSCDYAGDSILLKITAPDLSSCGKLVGQSEKNLRIVVIPPVNLPAGLTLDFSGQGANDTLFAGVGQEIRLPIRVIDPNTGDSLQVRLLSADTLLLNSPTPPCLSLLQDTASCGATLNGIGEIRGNFRWTAQASDRGNTYRFILETNEEGGCGALNARRDTFYVKIACVELKKPIFRQKLQCAERQGDTLLVTTGDSLCCSFSLEDLSPATGLGYELSLEDLQGVKIPLQPGIVTQNGALLNGEFCYKASCEDGGKIYRLVLAGIDSLSDNVCTEFTQNEVIRDTVYIRIRKESIQASLQINLKAPGLVSSGDTIFQSPGTRLTLPILFSEPNASTRLKLLLSEGPIEACLKPVSTGSTCIDSIQGLGRLESILDWNIPTGLEGQVFRFIVQGQALNACGELIELVDTVYVCVGTRSLPPIITLDLAGNDFEGKNLRIKAGASFCYEFTILDQTPTTGLSYDFEFQDLSGKVLSKGQVDALRLDNSIQGVVCYDAGCDEGNAQYRLVIKAIDEAAKNSCRNDALEQGQAEDAITVQITPFFDPMGIEPVFDPNTACLPTTAQFSLKPFTPQEGISYTWDFGDGNRSNSARPAHLYNKSGIYPVKLFVEDLLTQCRDTLSWDFEVVERELLIPNVFSPNDDGVEDCYKIDLNCRLFQLSNQPDSYRFRIVDRWGQLVHESESPQTCWDGRNREVKEVSEGVYFYSLKIKTLSGATEFFQGHITLLR